MTIKKRAISALRLARQVKSFWDDVKNITATCAKIEMPINVQAEEMGMRIVNNRKRMRKRVRQRRRSWDLYADYDRANTWLVTLPNNDQV